jgi:Zn-dependent peptidase ImmA (M78 family)
MGAVLRKRRCRHRNRRVHVAQPPASGVIPSATKQRHHAGEWAEHGAVELGPDTHAEPSRRPLIHSPRSNERPKVQFRCFCGIRSARLFEKKLFAKARKPRWWKRIIGATWFSERTVFIDRTDPDVRQQFTDGHEAMHALCPWHEPALRLLLDGDETLMGRSDIPVEIEADYGASYLIFQGGRFHRKALAEQVSLRTPLGMAGEYGASRHATAHYYVEGHPDAVAMLVAGRYVRHDGTLPVWRSIESLEFLRRFGRLEDHLRMASSRSPTRSTTPWPTSSTPRRSSSTRRASGSA